MRLAALVVLSMLACGSGSKPSCIEGASVACACANGGSGAQICDANGKLGACSCGNGSGAPTDSKCNLAAMKCASYSAQGRSGLKLHELVYAARTSGRHAEAICLAQNNVNTDDGWLRGATHFEISNAFEALGCHELAVAEIETALQRPRDQSWQATCAWCAQIRADCSPCKAAATERIACPSNGQLAMDVRDAMLKRAPSGVEWTKPTVDMCIPIGLPQPGWFVIGAVQQDTPTREFWFHLAVDARTSKVVAISEPDQRKYNYVCETKFGQVVDNATAPSKVRMLVTCHTKMGTSTPRNVEAEIAPPKIVLNAR